MGARLKVMLQSNGRKLSRMRALSPQQCSKLRERGIISCKVTTITPVIIFFQVIILFQEFLSVDVLELMSVLSLSYWQLEVLTHAVSQATAPQPRNVRMQCSNDCSKRVCAGTGRVQSYPHQCCWGGCWFHPHISSGAGQHLARRTATGHSDRGGQIILIAS